jgi:hypothetical protein
LAVTVWLALRRSADTTPNSPETLRQIILKATLYLAQVADLREFAQATEAGDGTLDLEQALRDREVRRADLYRQFEQAAFSPLLPVVARNELDLPEDN